MKTSKNRAIEEKSQQSTEVSLSAVGSKVAVNVEGKKLCLHKR